MRRLRRTLGAVLGIAVLGVSLIAQTNTANAAFNKDRIIDDNVFSNTASFSAAQVDAFLNSKNSCISQLSGFSAPRPSGYSPGGGYQFAENVSAGTVIATAAQVYGINPQVLLVTLQKEQSMVTSTSCSTNTISKSMGYGCPDNITSHDYTGLNLYSRNGTTFTDVTGTCVTSAAKAGFSQQVIRAAWLLKFSQERSLGNIGWAVITGNWDNSDDPQSCYSGAMTGGWRQACPSGATTYYDGFTTIDGQSVYMGSGATASLYRYTPHFHGNQNFALIWEGWWGDTLGGTYKWSTTGYSILTEDQSAYMDPGRLQPGGVYLAKLHAYNTGTATWYNSGPTPMTLGSWGPGSQFCLPGLWISCNRPARMQEASVPPGGLAHFVFKFKAPYAPGEYREDFKPVAEMLSWTNNTYGQTFGIKVVAGTYKWSTEGYQILDKNEGAFLDPGKLEPGETYVAKVTAYNTGTATWTNDGPTPVMLGKQSGNSVFCLPEWGGCNRPARLIESSVPPGSVGHFKFKFKAPYAPGEYREDFKPVAEMLSWTNNTYGQTFGIKVVAGTYKWSTTGYQILTEDNSAFLDPGNLQPNTIYLAKLLAYNTGTATWKNTGPTPMTLGRITGNSAFCTAGWIDCNRPVTMYESSVPPGGIAHFIFKFKTPATPGTYREDFKPVAELLSWTNDAYGQTFGVSVR